MLLNPNQTTKLNQLLGAVERILLTVCLTSNKCIQFWCWSSRLWWWIFATEGQGPLYKFSGNQLPWWIFVFSVMSICSCTYVSCDELVEVQG